MLILSLFVLRALSCSFCYDVQLEGNVKIGNRFMNVLRQPSELLNTVRMYLSSNIEGKGKLPRVLAPITMVMRASYNTSTEKIGNIENKTIINVTDPLERLVNHLQKKGRMSLKNRGTKIITDLNIKKNITPVLEIVTNDYDVMMQNYYKYVKKNQNGSERELIYLDMVETSCKLLFNEEKKLLNDIIMHENLNVETDSFKNMTDMLLQLNHRDKKEAMKYICDTYDVCRHYPAFTDYCANLISEVLILEDKKFRAVLDILTKILKRNEKIFAKISEKEDRILILEKVQYFSTDLFAARDCFAVARSALTQRFKTIFSGGATFKVMYKTTRIILDILDKALTTEDDILAIDFDNSVHFIRNWSAVGRNEIGRNLEELAKSLLRKLQHNLTKNARAEIKVLIQSLMRGNMKDNKLYQRLLKFGSNYVKHEDLHTDM